MNVFSDLELQGDIWRGWIVPVGGLTPDRLRKLRGEIAVLEKREGQLRGG